MRRAGVGRSTLAGVTAALETALNGYLALDPDSRARLAALRGGVVALHLDGLDTTLHFVPGHDRLQLSLCCDAHPDTRISGSPFALARLALAGDGIRLPAGVRVEGDARLGQQFRALLQGVDLDWEEWLSRLTGDLLAHRLGRAAHDLAGWARRAAEGLRLETGEYLQEESGVLPTRDEVEHFMDGVDRFRQDVDRLEARLRRLERSAGEGGS